jgi:hypothetical protein
MSVTGIYGHTIGGIFYFDVPVTVFLALIFHRIVKRNLIVNFSAFLQRRFHDTLKSDFLGYLKTNWGLFLVSAVLGAVSHVFWDSFTHNDRFFVRLFSDIYDSTYVPFDGANYPLFYVLQQVSTALGLTVVTVYILLKRPLSDFEPGAPGIGYWLLVFVIAIAVLRIRFFVQPSDYNLGNVVVTSITGLMAGVVIGGFFPFRNSAHYQKSLNG